MYHVGGNSYQLVKDHKNGWNFEVFRERYSEVLERYDFIVGDWGYNQLRLKGFFKENNNKGSKDSSIALLQDYLNEYCNFGCAYFIIERIASRKGQQGKELGGPGESELELTAYMEPEKPVDPDFKPRQHIHYHRSREGEQKGRSGERSFAGSQGQAASEGKGKEHREKSFRQGENRSKDAEHPQQRGARNGREGAGRSKEQQEGRGKTQPPNQHQGNTKKDNHPNANKGRPFDRNKDNRERSREKEKSPEPLAET